MFEVLEAVELVAVFVMTGLGLLIIDIIQRKFGHPLEYVSDDD